MKPASEGCEGDRPGFRATILFKFFESHDVRVEWMEYVLPKKSYEAEIVEDMMNLIASFSAKVYGRRSADRQTKKPKVPSE